MHATGGLVDTVADANQDNLAEGNATGFAFRGYRLDQLEHTLGRGVSISVEPSRRFGLNWWNAGMRQDWSWQRSAQLYSQLYEQTVAKKRCTG